MKSVNKFLLRSAVALAGVVAFSSCSMEEPFAAGEEGNLTLTTEIRGDVVKTRAISDDELATLREKCVVYIENNNGVIRKYKGIDNIPESIRLREGSYVAEAWSGDSVSASFDSKFYRGYQKFDIQKGENALTLNCNIANVLVSVNPESLNVNLNDIKVSFWHSRGSLEFTEDLISDGKKGYFMMPNADKDLNYKVEGTQLDGTPFAKEGVIANVQRAHEYAMTISADPVDPDTGGALIRLTIADIPVIEEDIDIFSAPVLRGVDFDIEGQVISTSHDFSDTKVYVAGYFGLASLAMDFSSDFTDMSSYSNILDNSAITELASKGIKVEKRESVDASAVVGGEKVKVEEVYITFTKSFLDALPDCSTEYVVTLTATDIQSGAKSTTAQLRIANTEDAIVRVAPVGAMDTETLASNFMAVGAYSATLTGYVYDADNAANFGIKYRQQGESEWTAVYPTSSSAAAARRAARATRGIARAKVAPFTVKISGLQPATAYEYKAFCDDYDEAPVATFTTEGLYQIPNSSMEDWGTYQDSSGKTIVVPGLTGSKYTCFWGSGNEGSATVSLTLTDKSTEMTHSGSYCALLESKKAVITLAAGNVFTGYYDRTDGTNGVLQLGREYNGSHPAKLRVWVNYRPGSVDKTNSEVAEIVKGELDYGQIYIALTDEVVEVRTNPNDRKLFSPDDQHVLAYGQVTWHENYGPDGALQELLIPFEYNDRAKTKKPTHLVIVCAASKYGDYFAGSYSSKMYLDDFELVYE